MSLRILVRRCQADSHSARRNVADVAASDVSIGHTTGTMGSFLTGPAHRPPRIGNMVTHPDGIQMLRMFRDRVLGGLRSQSGELRE
jgi:hypothetical protein